MKVRFRTSPDVCGSSEGGVGAGLAGVVAWWTSAAASWCRPPLSGRVSSAGGHDTSSTSSNPIEGKELTWAVCWVLCCVCSWFGPIEYRWALSQVWSRFISISVARHGQVLKAMAPFFDMINHDPKAQTVSEEEP
jgi:hypothetical protein